MSFENETSGIWLFPQSADTKVGGFKDVEDLQQYMEVELLAPDGFNKRDCHGQVVKPTIIAYYYGEKIYGHLEVDGWDSPKATDKYGENQKRGKRVYLIKAVVPYSAPVAFTAIRPMLSKYSPHRTQASEEVFVKITELGKPKAAITSVPPVTEEDFEKVDRIRRRLRQFEFRRCLNKAYNGCCAVTPCKVEIALEAAHIKPYCDGGTSEVSNGILLRSDIHALFDAGLIAFEPGTGRVTLSADLSETDYAIYEGKIIDRPKNEAEQPDIESLRFRWESRQR